MTTRQQVVASLQSLALRMLAGDAGVCRCGRYVEREGWGSWSAPDGGLWCADGDVHAPVFAEGGRP
jgi:hypothetical protein